MKQRNWLEGMKGCLWEMSYFNTPLPAEGVFEQGTVSLFELEQHCWGGLGNFRTTPLLHFLHLLSALQQSKWKVTKTLAILLKETSFLSFSLQISLMVAQEPLRRGTTSLTESYPLGFALQSTTSKSFKPAAETLALWLKMPRLIFTWLHGH